MTKSRRYMDLQGPPVTGMHAPHFLFKLNFKQIFKHKNKYIALCNPLMLNSGQNIYFFSYVVDLCPFCLGDWRTKIYSPNPLFSPHTRPVCVAPVAPWSSSLVCWAVPDVIMS